MICIDFRDQIIKSNEIISNKKKKQKTAEQSLHLIGSESSALAQRNLSLSFES